MYSVNCRLTINVDSYNDNNNDRQKLFNYKSIPKEKDNNLIAPYK